MSPGALRARLAARVASTGYPQADGLLGMDGVPRTIGPVCWQLALTGAVAQPNRQRSGSTEGIFMRWGLELQVLAAGNPARRIDQWDIVLDAEARLRHALLQYVDGDGLDCVRNAIVFESADPPVYLEGGLYRMTTQRYHVTLTESLE
jgi:hypothetical protein